MGCINSAEATDETHDATVSAGIHSIGSRQSCRQGASSETSESRFVSVPLKGGKAPVVRTPSPPLPPPPPPSPSPPAPYRQSSTDMLFPDLVPFRLDDSDLLRTRKVASEFWLGHYDGQSVAVKRMPYDSVREIQTMARLEHANIVQFLGCIWTSTSDLETVTEFMDGGDVRSLLENRAVALSWAVEKIGIAIDIASALAYMHSLKPASMHRDLKSSNVLLNAQMVAKLNNFSLSRERSYDETLTAGVGTICWTAPEVMMGDHYSERADIYSFGVVLSELDTREIPFEEKFSSNTTARAANMIMVVDISKGKIRPKFNDDCPVSVATIAQSCLQFDISLRPSAATLLRQLKEAKYELEMAQSQ